MNNKKHLKGWINKIDETEIKRMFAGIDDLEEMPSGLDEKGLRVVRNSGNYREKSFKITDIFTGIKFSGTRRFAVSFSFTTALIILIAGLAYLFINNSVLNAKNYCIATGSRNIAYVQHPDGTKKSLYAGEKIGEGSVVSTAEGASAGIKIGEKIDFELQESSEIKITGLDKNLAAKTENSKVYLYKGGVYFKIGKLAAGSSFTIGTDTVTTGVRGTEFSINYDEEKNYSLLVKSGVVTVTPAFKTDYIDRVRNISPELTEKIKSAIGENYFVNAGYSFNLTHEEFSRMEDEIAAIVKPLVSGLENNRNSKEKIRDITGNSGPMIQKIKDRKNELIGRNIIRSRDDSTNAGSKETAIVNETNPDIKPQILIGSPENKYYENGPGLVFTAEKLRNLKIFLNDFLTDQASGSQLKNLQTGFNKLKITAEDNNGHTAVKEVIFFINNLKTDTMDSFDRQNSSVIGNDWAEDEGPGDSAIGIIASGKLVFSGPVKRDNSYCTISKIKLLKPGKRLIESIDIEKMNLPAKGNSDVELGIHMRRPDSSWALEAVLQDDESGAYRLILRECRNKPDPNSWMISETPVNMDFSEKYRLIFYKNENNYSGIIIDSHSNITAVVSKTNYNPMLGGSYFYDNIKISGFIEKADFNAGELIILDNFYLYK